MNDDHMTIYDMFWRDLVETDGQLDRDKVARELADYHFIIQQLPLVYEHVTGGRMSKHMYFANDVIREADAQVDRVAAIDTAQAVAEELAVLADEYMAKEGASVVVEQLCRRREHYLAEARRAAER